MRPKAMIATAVVGAALICAGPAVAKKSEKTLIMSTHVTNVRTLSRGTSALTATVPASAPGTVVHSGYRSECTTPNDQNFYTSNTFESWGVGNTLVSDCYALLWLNTSTTGSLLTWDLTNLAVATVQSCRVYAPDNESDTIVGAGTVTTNPLGLFVETCTASAGQVSPSVAH
ncbi:MAG: hypothetical protein ACLPZR_08160 [Solirubrobacteraceae bacterium]